MTRVTVSLEEAAKRLGVSKRTIYMRIKEGILQTIRVGRSQRVIWDDSLVSMFRHYNSR